MTAVAGFALALLTFAAWSVASAPGASPDDDFHLASIWCGLGEREGLCEPGTTPEARLIPAAVRDATCYVHQPNDSAACSIVSQPTEMLEVVRWNWNGIYPPVYYAVTGIFASHNVELSVIAIRAVNVVIFLAVIALLFSIAPPVYRRLSVLAPIVTTLPLGLFIIASVNPSSWAISAAFAVGGSLLLLPRLDGWQRWTAIGLAAVGAFIGAGARADSAIATGLAAVLALIVGLRRHRSSRWLIAAALIVVAISAAFFIVARQSSVATEGLNSNPPQGFDGYFRLFQIVALEIPQLLLGVVGTWRLGWFEVPVAAWVWATAAGVLAVTLWTAIRRPGRRRGTAILVGAVAIYGYGIALQILSQAVVGEYVQPRYLLPMIIVLVMTAIADRSTLDELSTGLSPVQRWVPVIALAIAGSAVLHDTIRRYTVGNDGGLSLTPGADGWWWSGWPLSSANAVWLVGSCAYAGLLVLLAWRTRSRRRPEMTLENAPMR